MDKGNMDYIGAVYDGMDRWASGQASTISAQAAEIARLRDAAIAVEEWWLNRGMQESVGGAPVCIFMIRAAMEPKP